MIELDHLAVELSGTNLIEASAGTGKTYAIACLYLRLLIEKELTPEQILVVTYTEAATNELHGRVRERIREALAVMDGAISGDPFLNGLCTKGDMSRGRELLNQALCSFDTAAIFTIHGFCLRALQDNAFESGSLYDTELVRDQTPLLREIVDDFWRRRFFGEPSPLLGYALRSGLGGDSFMAFLKDVGVSPCLNVIPRFAAADIAAAEEACRSLFGALRDVWRASGDEVRGILCEDKGLSRAATTYRSDLLPPLFSAMDAYAAGDNPFDLFSDFAKYTASGIAAGTKQKKDPPQHPFFPLCQELHDMVQKRFLALKSELLLYCREQLQLRKQEGNIRFFDDLLNDLHQALGGESGPSLAATIRGKYRAALIDEFQDTDPVQYDIFRTIYAVNDCPLFLIGDPKQAIYSFRGADIFAYMQASQDVPEGRRFTLTGNWRSLPGLLTAFNTVFDNARHPFVYDRINYHPVSSGRKETVTGLTTPQGDAAGLQIWYLPADEGCKPFSVGKATDLAAAAVTGEIARLLREGEEGRALIGDRALAPRDIAVIVRSHRQARLIQDSLRRQGIPGVMRSDMSVFATDEARQLCTLLAALADPASETRVRAALVTDILGRRGNDIAGLMEDESAWEECLERFREYHGTWLEEGFMVMVRLLLAREGVRGRFLRHPDGERRLTNLLHCLELIHSRAHGRGAGMEGVVTWFHERVAAGDAAEEYQIRLETDEMAVRIVTIHVSKGLEYPVVFCPFLWGGVGGDDRVVSFHDDFTMVKDFGSPDLDKHRVLAQKESLAENLRLVYVALTRAQYRCYLLTGKIVDSTHRNRPETSPLAYLFHASPDTRMADDLVAALAREVSGLDHDQTVRQLQGFSDQSRGNIAVSQFPDASVPSPLGQVSGEGAPVCRTFGGLITGDWRVASFTSFAGHGAGLAELPDRDETGEERESGGEGGDEAPEGRSMFTFPRGARAGIFMHGIFENLDFSDSDPQKVTSLVAQGLEKHGYDGEWLSPVSSMVTTVISAPLTSPEGSFTLSSLRRGDWLSELEFFFPLRFITSHQLGNCLAAWGGGRHAAVDLSRICGGLDFKPVRGMVRGFMDMVFQQGGRYYLLDWKSNHLGSCLEDYGQQALKRAMEANLYPLQYLLYTVALNRYLSLRIRGYDYATHFGGVLYLFLRGVDGRHGERYGVFRDLPPGELIADLTECLIRAGG